MATYKRDKKKTESDWSKATWGMSLTGRFGEYAVRTTLGHQPCREQPFSLPAGDVSHDVRPGVSLPIEIKAGQTCEGVPVRIRQLEAGLAAVDGSAEFCGLVHAVFRYRNKVRLRRTGMPVSGLARCRSLDAKTKYLFERTVEIAYVDSRLLLDIAERQDEVPGFYRWVPRLPGAGETGPSLLLYAKFFQSLRGLNGDWTPHVLGLDDRGWTQVTGKSELRYDDHLRQAFPSHGKKGKPRFELAVDREVPLVGILSAQTAAALASGHRCSLRQQLNIPHRRVPQARDPAPLLDAELVPF